MTEFGIGAILFRMREFILFTFSFATLFGQIAGVVDLHTHADPDVVPRKIDVFELAKLAKASGMRAIVLKNHYISTAPEADLVRQIVPGIEVFGGIALNASQGGINPSAVDLSTQYRGHYLRVVWMPTLDAENHVKFNHLNHPFISVAKDGNLLPDVIEVLKLIAKNNLTLATGHSSAVEDLLLIQEAKKVGVRRIVVTHPMLASIHMTILQMETAAKQGAYLELCANSVLPTATENKLRVEDYVQTIRAVGADHIVLSSDLGQPMHPVHTEGWKQFLDLLMKAGVSSREIDLMARKNPALLVGLD